MHLNSIEVIIILNIRWWYNDNIRWDLIDRISYRPNGCCHAPCQDKPIWKFSLWFVFMIDAEAQSQKSMRTRMWRRAIPFVTSHVAAKMVQCLPARFVLSLLDTLHCIDVSKDSCAVWWVRWEGLRPQRRDSWCISWIRNVGLRKPGKHDFPQFQQAPTW